MIDPFREGEEFLPLATVAKRLCISIITVRSWRRTRGLKTTKLGHRDYLTKESWGDFLVRCNSPKPAERKVRTKAQFDRDQIAAAKLCESMGI